ncbi:MAG: prolipoprotein diacylglyceryl transferase, partial [Hyphomicrobiaceae bacterium]|nr:prolipoprotein diacylglyceryl transferase [Hyphomicrobiaceae bacterium]
MPLVIPYPAIDPIALQLGPISVKWYGIAYLAGLVLGWLYIKQLLRTERLWPSGKPALEADDIDDLLLWMTLGVVVGGRLGNVLLYHPGYYLKNPLEIFALWHGGMSFHGGLIGSVLAIWLFARRRKVATLTVGDLCAAAVPIGIFFGRIANFINAEIVGRPSNVPWAMVFPGAGPVPRHPSQLYEAGL